MSYSKILIFSLQNKEYGIEIEHVERIIGSDLITKVIDSDEFIDGVIDYEQGVLTVVNLSKLFLETSKGKEVDSKVVVVVSDGVRVGLRVDSVRDVIEVKKELIEPLPIIVISSDENKIKGLIKAKGTIKILLDAQKFLKYK